MQDEHCILLALPCGRDNADVLQQSNNLKNGFINYLQSKQAAGIVNSSGSGPQAVSYTEISLISQISNHLVSLVSLADIIRDPHFSVERIFHRKHVPHCT